MDRQIYESPGGQKYDPLRLWRALVRGSQGKINQWIRDRQSDDLLKAADAEELLVNLVRSTFQIPTDETDQNVLDTLAHFNRWLSGKGSRG